MTAPVRAAGVELLDDPAADPALVARVLTDLIRANRWLGGVAAMRHGLTALFDRRDTGGHFTLLDVGTGAGDLPRAATRWAARRGITLHTVGLERLRAAARCNASRGGSTLLACGTALPFADAGIDIVSIAQLLHHFDDDTVVRMLAEAHRVAARGVVITDLWPTPGAAAGFRLAGRALGLHQVTIDDGVTSLARGRRTAALAALAVRAGAVAPRATSRPPARVIVSWRTDS